MRVTGPHTASLLTRVRAMIMRVVAAVSVVAGVVASMMSAMAMAGMTFLCRIRTITMVPAMMRAMASV